MGVYQKGGGMGEIVPFVLKSLRREENLPGKDINQLLGQAVKLQKEVFGEVRNGIYHMRGSFKDLMEAKICAILLKEKIIRNDLFQCSLYLAKMMAEITARVPRSYYAVDYFIQGFGENNPLIIREGADYCAMLCIFFEGRRGWRSMRPRDYEVLGSSLYHAYYDLTKKPIGWYMSKNFKEMVPIARRSIESLRN
jgi:hypothetical protein